MDQPAPPMISLTSAEDDSEHGTVQHSVIYSGSDRGQPTSSTLLTSRSTAQSQVFLQRHDHRQNQNGVTTTGQPLRIGEVPRRTSELILHEQASTKLADEDYPLFLPPSRSPTEEDVSAIYSVSASVSPEFYPHAFERASTVSDIGVGTWIPPNGSASERRMLIRSSTGDGRLQRTSRRPNDLRDAISTAMAKGHEIGLYVTKHYLSDAELSRLITDENIRATLPSVRDDVVNFVKHNPKVLAITALVITDPGACLDAMQAFLAHEFSDQDLPIVNMIKDKNCLEYVETSTSSDEESDLEPAQLACKHESHADAFHDWVWSPAYLKDFFDKQWGFLIPKFSKHTIKYAHNDEILPFKEVITNQGDDGHFSVVHKAKLLARHQDAVQTNNKTILVAIKELKNKGLETDIRRDWLNELKALSAFNELQDASIVKGIGAFTQRGKYYLIMEWADGRSLQQFWDKCPDPHLDLNQAKVMELLEQSRGLTDALYQMHHSHTPQKAAGSSLLVVNAPGDDPNEKNWRHGDLKPSNILRFNDGTTWLGKLKIGDLGRARQHEQRTQFRHIATAERFGHERYEPPEGWTSLEIPRSRLYDIWSLGCIFLESVVWMLKGIGGLKEFDPINPGPAQRSPYWACEGNNYLNRTTKVRESASSGMQRMLDLLPQPSALHDFVSLVRDKLLIVRIPPDVDTYTPGCRANTSTVLQGLNDIISKAKQDDSYLFQPSLKTAFRGPLVEKVLLIADSLDVNRAAVRAGNAVTRRTSLPLGNRPFDDTGRRDDSYIHDFDDTWRLEEDNIFARKVLDRVEIDVQSIGSAERALLCEKCKRIDVTASDIRLQDTVEELAIRKREGCGFCAMRLRVAEEAGTSKAEFFKSSSGLRMVSSPSGLPILSFRRLSGNDARIENGPNYIQMGFPRLPGPESAAHVGLLRAWLEDCDANHVACRRITTANVYPTRLIDVGSCGSPNLRLVQTRSLRKSEQESLKYIALSHPWGKPGLHRHFCTTRSNIQDYGTEIKGDLPQTLADAVKTTRRLGVSYLWIDSLCIIQGDDGDFSDEAERMETVYSSAYCVIATTSADGSTSGFLRRHVEHEIVSLPYRSEVGDELGKIYVSINFDDFEKDVRNSSLNQRGWVLQERALARRTIHFANSQTYWECGEGIRCESLSKLRNNYEMLLGDPEFPTYGLRFKKGGDIAFYESLYQQYSNMLLSRPEDRPVAIGGLEQRLIRALKAKEASGFGNFGIFDEYWGRGLLWQRAPHVPKMARLTSVAGIGQPAPSWSWMGYTGAIAFMKHDPRAVEWLDGAIKFPWSDQKGPRSSTTSYRGGLGLRGVARDFHARKGNCAVELMNIVYEDEGSLTGRKLKCFIIGRESTETQPMEKIVEKHLNENLRNYVLILAKKSAAGRDNVYERVGAGFIHGSLIEFDRFLLTVSIV